MNKLTNIGKVNLFQVVGHKYKIDAAKTELSNEHVGIDHLSAKNVIL
jgi:hypothetical protein